MSRAYRIRVRESLKRVLRAHDHVSTQLELLELLPPEQMAALLEQELLARGFERQGDVVARQLKDGVTVAVNPTTGTVTVQAEALERIDLESEKVGRAYDDAGPAARELKKLLKDEVKRALAKQAERKEAVLQSQVADALEAQLHDLKTELDQAVNRVTAEALKRKAAQLGTIKQMTEDPQNGSLTIVLEV